VGYGAVALFKGQTADGRGAAAFSLSDAEEDELMVLARKSVEMAVKQQKLYECPASAREPLMQERGAFVTLKKNGKLRGCIGYPAPLKPLYFTVRDVAAMAAVRDIRFPPVGPKELPELQYEISVLSPLRRVLDVNRIEVGKHGLVVKKGSKEGLLLPQVPVEQGWDRITFLQQACVKAGLPVGAWKDEDTDVFAFTALVFGEHAGNEAVSGKPSSVGR
jgi:AmmeMemoRadiSam system protein A